MDIKEFTNKNNIICVVGVSLTKETFGLRIYRSLKRYGYKVYAVNPKCKCFGNDNCYERLNTLPEKPDVVITVVKPNITKEVIKECKRLGISKVWMQPGSESEDAIRFCKNNNMDIVHNACFIVDGIQKPLV